MNILYIVAIPVLAYAVVFVAKWPSGWKNRLQVKIHAPVEFAFKYYMENTKELEAKYYHKNENDQTQIFPDEMVTPTHLVKKSTVIKRLFKPGSIWAKIMPSFLVPNPKWEREMNIYTDKRLMDLKIKSDNIGMSIRFSFLGDIEGSDVADVDDVSILRCDSEAKTLFSYKVFIWYSGAQEEAQLGFITGVKKDVEAAYRKISGK